MTQFKKEYPDIAAHLINEGRQQASGGAPEADDLENVREQAAREWKASAAIRHEFVTLENYRAYRVASAKGLVRVLGAGARRV